MTKQLLEFQHYGNRLWHRCRKLYDAWIEALDGPRIEVAVRMGRYSMIWDEMLRRTNPSLPLYTSLNGYLTQRELLVHSLVPMFKISDSDGDVVPCYFCPACERTFDEIEVESGRTINFGSKKSDSHRQYGYE
jgi:hypothetical protein